MDGLMRLWQREPAVIIGVAVAALNAAVVFGVPLTVEQKAALVTVLTSIGAVAIRSRVSPV